MRMYGRFCHNRRQIYTESRPCLCSMYCTVGEWWNAKVRQSIAGIMLVVEIGGDRLLLPGLGLPKFPSSSAFLVPSYEGVPLAPTVAS